MAMEKEIKDYRLHLVDARQKAFDDFDKTVITLSGAALGVSITFFKDLIGPGATFVSGLLLSWTFWSLSLLAVLVSYFVSQLTLDKAIAQIDSDARPSRPGGTPAKITKILNLTGGGFFLLGLILFMVFVYQNSEVLHVKTK
jgi:hypothetical protein